jgi:hypothetical protein
MDPYQEMFDEWFRCHYHEVRDRAVRSRWARGDFHGVEDAIQIVLERLLRNRDRQRHEHGLPVPTYRQRIHRHATGEIRISTGGNSIPLSSYILRGIHNVINIPRHRLGELPDEDLLEGEGNDTIFSTDFGHVFETLRPCLDEIRLEYRIALVHRFAQVCPALQPCLDGYIPALVVLEWLLLYNPGQRGLHLFYGRERLLRCLWQRGVVVDLLIELTQLPGEGSC